MINNNEILTPKQVCEVFKLKLSTLRLYTRQNRIPSIKIGKHVRYNSNDISTLSSSGTNNGAQNDNY